MPIYEFECPSCGSRFEDLVTAGTERTSCPECGGANAERRMSNFATSRQLTPNQRRRLEDKRGTDRDGARTRFKQSMAKARAKGSRLGGSGGSGGTG